MVWINVLTNCLSLVIDLDSDTCMCGLYVMRYYHTPSNYPNNSNSSNGLLDGFISYFLPNSLNLLNFEFSYLHALFNRTAAQYKYCRFQVTSNAVKLCMRIWFSRRNPW